MRKKYFLLLGMVMVIGTLIGCGKNEEFTSDALKENTETVDEMTDKEENATNYVTYEFETFDGDTIVIDSKNIVSQESDENPLESEKVPDDAEVIAPGRDYVYLADTSYYYVEDAENNLVTIANKNTSDIDNTDVDSDEVFSTDDYSISYTKGLFEAYEVRGFVRLSYCNSDLQFAGSNEIIITKDEGTTVDDIIQAIAGDDKDNISDGLLGNQEIPTKNYTRISKSPADDSLTLYDSFVVMQSGDDVITLEVIRTVGQDDETDMTIDGAFTHTFESFVLK